MPKPILSVVIPTSSRPHFLPRAVRSALEAAHGGDLEVIVVPNGPDQSWRESLAEFSSDGRVVTVPVDHANANVARNRGLTLARGKYVRFLDDDDQLSALGASAQLVQIDAHGAELCSGSVLVVDSQDVPSRRMSQMHDKDLFCAMARPGRVCLPTAHLFLRAALEGWEWDERLPVEQDTDWMFRLSSSRNWKWVAIDEVVGRWTQHDQGRVSDGISHPKRGESTGTMLLTAVERLRTRDELTPIRAEAAAEGLWESIHSHFYRAPLKWSRMARQARLLSPTSRPADAFHQSKFGRQLNPILVEWAMIPKRWLNRVTGYRPAHPADRDVRRDGAT